MSGLQQLLDDTIVRLRRADTDLQDVEVKDASRGTPGALPDLVSAFATGSGGLLILGLSETQGFTPTPIDASALADAVGSVCANDVEPPVRPDIDICTNALMHRDYHPMAHGTQVRMSLYPDRLEIANPGGLHGSVSKDSLLVESVSSISRNATLSTLLEDVQGLDDRRMIAENRGSGLLATAALLRRAGMDPPELTDAVHQLTAVLPNHGLLDEEALAWLGTIDNGALNDRQRLALAFVRRRGQLTNRIYRTISGCNAQTATRDLGSLHTLGLLDKRGDRRGTTWVLASMDASAAIEREPDLFDPAPVTRQRMDRRARIEELLRSGSLSSAEIAERLGIGRRNTLSWLSRMEAEGVVERTEAKLNSRHNRWRLKPLRSR